MKVLINRILEYQIKNRSILEHEKDIYIYAYTILVEECINIAIAIVIGLFFRQLNLVVCFLCAYIPLRQFSGGYHAEHWKTCRAISTLIIVFLCIFFYMNIKNSMYDNTYIILIFSQLCIFILSPVDSVNKRLNDREKMEYHKITMRILIVQILILIFGIWTKMRFLYIGIIYSHIVLSLMLIIGLYKNCEVRRKIE